MVIRAQYSLFYKDTGEPAQVQTNIQSENILSNKFVEFLVLQRRAFPLLLQLCCVKSKIKTQDFSKVVFFLLFKNETNNGFWTWHKFPTIPVLRCNPETELPHLTLNHLPQTQEDAAPWWIPRSFVS